MRGAERPIVLIKLQGGWEWPSTIARRKVRGQTYSPTLSFIVGKWGVDDRPMRVRVNGVLHRFPFRHYLSAQALIGYSTSAPIWSEYRWFSSLRARQNRSSELLPP